MTNPPSTNKTIPSHTADVAEKEASASFQPLFRTAPTIEPSSSSWFAGNGIKTICVLRVIVSLICGYLAWDCNRYINFFMRFLITLFAIVFSEIYILYYAVYRTFMGNKCYIELNELSYSSPSPSMRTVATL